MNSSTLPTHFHLFTAAFCLLLAACCLLPAAAAAASASRRFEVSRRLALLTGYQRPRPLRGCKPAHPLSVCATFQRCIITISGQILPLSAPVNQIHFATPAGAGKMGVVFYFHPKGTRRSAINGTESSASRLRAMLQHAQLASL